MQMQREKVRLAANGVLETLDTLAAQMKALRVTVANAPGARVPVRIALDCMDKARMVGQAEAFAGGFSMASTIALACRQFGLTPQWFERTRHAVAAVEHERWAHWTDHMLETIRAELHYQEDFDALDCVVRWRRQIATAYSDLTDDEKASDLEWADKAIDAMRGVGER
jgi:hypothetical protein